MLDRRLFLAGAAGAAAAAFLPSPAAAGPAGFPTYQYLGTAFNKANLRYNPTNELIFPCIRGMYDKISNARARYYLYYAPHDAPGGICLAYGNSLAGPFTEYPANPIISRTWSPHFSVSHVSSPHIIWNAANRQFYLYFHAAGEVELHKLVHRFLGRADQLNEALVYAHLELLTGLLIHVNRPIHRVLADPGRQQHRATLLGRRPQQPLELFMETVRRGEHQFLAFLELLQIAHFHQTEQVRPRGLIDNAVEHRMAGYGQLLIRILEHPGEQLPLPRIHAAYLSQQIQGLLLCFLSPIYVQSRFVYRVMYYPKVVHYEICQVIGQFRV